MDDRNEKILVMILLTLLVLASIAAAQGQPTSHPPSLFADKRAFQVGDIITILLMEYTEGSNASTTNNDFEHRVEMKNSVSGALDFLPILGLDAGIDSDQRAKGNTSRQGSLRGKMSALVVEVLPNGNLVLEGQRTVEVNGEQQITILRGVVRPSDIIGDNTVYSYLIADANITYRGKGVVDQATRPGILSRIIGWLF